MGRAAGSAAVEMRMDRLASPMAQGSLYCIGVGPWALGRRQYILFLSGRVEVLPLLLPGGHTNPEEEKNSRLMGSV